MNNKGRILATWITEHNIFRALMGKLDAPHHIHTPDTTGLGLPHPHHTGYSIDTFYGRRLVPPYETLIETLAFFPHFYYTRGVGGQPGLLP